MSTVIDESAERLAAARRNHAPCAPVRDLLGETDLDAAYAVQSILARERIASGARVVGRKIGLTSLQVQAQLGVHQPDFGVVFDDTLAGHGEPISLEDYLQPRVEAEIAFVLQSDLDNPKATVVDVLRATDFVLPAIEVVDSRIADWDIRITDTVADNASSGGVALGLTPYSLRGRDLGEVAMVMEHLGQPVSTGSGTACLGSPVNAVAWLAREVARRGDPLRAGEVVMSGALGPMVRVTNAGVYSARLSGLGSVDAVFEGELR